MSTVYKVHDVTVTSVKGNTGRALVSVYGNVDYQGDRVMPGAFTNTLAKWEASGDPLPFIWSHQWSDPFAHLGVVTKFTDTPKGLVVDFKIDSSTDFAKQVVKLLDERRVTQMSFAYDVINERKAEDGANELLELSLIECGPCLSGANPLTELLSRKAVQEMLARESRTVSKARESFVNYPAAGWHDRDILWADLMSLFVPPAQPAKESMQWISAKPTTDPEAEPLDELRWQDAADAARRKAAQQEAAARQADAELFEKMEATWPGAKAAEDAAREQERERQRLNRLAEENSRLTAKPGSTSTQVDPKMRPIGEPTAAPDTVGDTFTAPVTEPETTEWRRSE